VTESHRSALSGNVVCFSTADWDTLLPTNKHHLMRRLAARGTRVLYIETLGTRAPRLASGTDLARIGRRVARGFAGPVKREKRLWTVSPVVRPAWSSRAAIMVNQAAFRAQLGGVLAKFSDPIAWIYSPYAVYLLEQTSPRRVVYHMVDDLSAVPGADKEALREAESLLLARADVVFCSERSLFDRARRVSPNCYFMPNVADFRHFSRNMPLPGNTRLARMESLRRPRIVFSGNIAPHKVDIDLLAALAERHRDFEFVLIGPQWEGADAPKSLARLEKLPNATLLGHVPYEELPAFLHAADVLVIPYVQNEATRAVFPLKVFEYLATGRPVVASPLPSLLPYRGAVRIAETLDEWSNALAEALRDTHEMELQRRALARRHTWERRITEMEEALAGLS